MDSLKTELTFAGVNVEFDDISMGSISDTQFMSSAVAGVVGTIVLGPLGGILGGLLGGLFGDSKEEKIRKAKKGVDTHYRMPWMNADM